MPDVSGMISQGMHLQRVTCNTQKCSKSFTLDSLAESFEHHRDVPGKFSTTRLLIHTDYTNWHHYLQLDTHSHTWVIWNNIEWKNSTFGTLLVTAPLWVVLGRILLLSTFKYERQFPFAELTYIALTQKKVTIIIIQCNLINSFLIDRQLFVRAIFVFVVLVGCVTVWDITFRTLWCNQGWDSCVCEELLSSPSYGVSVFSCCMAFLKCGKTRIAFLLGRMALVFKWGQI